MTVIIFIIVLAVLIFVHELGHFLAARACGIRVDAFSIGFGPKIFSWRYNGGETEYSLRLIPFGGYVKIFGENPDDESLHGPDSYRSFIKKPRWQQIIVLAAGVIFNLVFAYALYAGVFMFGVTASPDGFEQYSNQMTNARIMITDVATDSPAQKVGIKIGDTIIGSSTEAIQQAIQDSKGKTLTLEIVRHGQSIRLNLEATTTPLLGAASSSDPRYVIGIAMQPVADLHLSFFPALWEGMRFTVIMIGRTVEGLASFVSTIFRGTANFSDISGPVGIAGIVGDAAGLGFTYLLMVTALISINLGVVNLIPFPALDGGRIIVVLIEFISRRQVPPKVINIINMIGFILLMALMVLVTYKDIMKLVK